MRLLLSFQRPPSLAESASFRGARPTRRPEAPAGRPESIARVRARRLSCAGVSDRENGQPEPPDGADHSAPAGVSGSPTAPCGRSLDRAQPAEAPATDLQHLPVGPLGLHVVLAGPQLGGPECDAALV